MFPASQPTTIVTGDGALQMQLILMRRRQRLPFVAAQQFHLNHLLRQTIPLFHQLVHRLRRMLQQYEMFMELPPWTRMTRLTIHS
jgi:hypothetical protein